MLAISLLGLLVAGVFSMQRGALTIARTITEQQESSMRTNSFVELVRRNLEQTPGNARISLDSPRSGDTSELMLKDFPLAFSWSGVAAGSKSVLLRTYRNGVGQYSAAVLYLDDESTQDYENGRLNENATDRSTGFPKVRQLQLMEGIRTLTWSFYDPSTQDWAPDWPRDKNQRPSLIQLDLEMMDSAEPLHLVFWVPVMANPQSFANSTGGGSTGGGGQTPRPPGGGTIDVTPPPTGGAPPGGVPPGGGRRP